VYHCSRTTRSNLRNSRNYCIAVICSLEWSSGEVSLQVLNIISILYKWKSNAINPFSYAEFDVIPIL
jgi:hypothetical protein